MLHGTPRVAPAAAALALLGAGILTAGGALAQGSQRAEIPKLPPPHVLEPEHYDSNGCQLFPASEASDAPWVPHCGPTADGTAVAEDGAWQSLRGFVGHGYSAALRAQDVVIVEGSVSTSSSGRWQGWGLVRNETTTEAGAVVSAALFGSDGRRIETASAPIPIGSLRPGEPGPFVLDAAVEAAQVARVEWSVRRTAARTTHQRDFLIRQFWTLPYGERERATSFYSDPEGPGPYPHVLAGDVENVASHPLARPTIVAAWIDAEGRVRAVSTAQAGEVPFNAANAATMPAVVDPGMPSPFFLTNDDPALATTLTGLTPMLWAVTS